MKNKWRILKILITLILFGFLLNFSLKRFSNSRMDKISVRMIDPENEEKVYFIDEKNVIDFVKKANPSGRIGDIDIPNLEREIHRFPSVDSANVFLNLNGDLNINIVQRIPAFRLHKNGENFYVDTKGEEFPISKIYSHPVMLVSGEIPRDEYLPLIELVNRIKKDDFYKNYFIGISKEKGSYHLLTNDGHFKVEIGKLEKIDFKLKGFKEFVKRFLAYQNPEKYNKISVRFDNQIVTTLNPHYKANDSILSSRKKDLEKNKETLEAQAVSTPPKTER
ncbi:cell division protein FtsQ [Bergeyella sp. RCAD1439]|nr:cell division protein FtsQ [Bergeyella sp. RCAD1439]